MGLRGPGATARKLLENDLPKRRRTDPWKKPGLSRAERVIAFLENLSVTAGVHAGRKLKLRDWQKRWIRRIYRQDRFKRRIVRNAVKSIARKNGKTAEAAGLALCHLMGPEAEPRGEVYSAANDRTQAGKLFDEMVAMLMANPQLRFRVNIVRFHKKIEVMEGDGVGSVYMALSADAETKHGLSPSMVVYDELGQAKKRDLLDALDTAMGARANPLLLVISTQAADDNAPMSELIDYGLRVRSGEVVDPSFDLEFWTAPIDADPWSEETWRLANPALGDFRSIEDVRRMARQAQEQRSKEPAFRNLILNQRIAAHVRFLSRAEWKACEASYTLDDLVGSPCVGALDLSGVRDLTALVLIFLKDGLYWSWPVFFMPEEVVRDRSEIDAMPYERWAQEGHIQLIPGPTNDPEAIARYIAGLVARLGLKLIAYDRWRIEDLVREMKKQGQDVMKASELKGQTFDGLVLAEHGQGFKDMAVAVDALEQIVAQGTFRHPGNPVMTMCAANAVTERDPAGNRKFDKPKSTGRIDGIVAAAMAARMAINPPEQEGPSIYAERGALVV